MKKNSVTGRNNIVANRDVNNIFQMQAINQEVELGVINEIFDFVIKEAKCLDLDESKKAFTSDRLIHIVKKISINFCEKDEIVEVKQYFTNLYSKIHSVEKSFQALNEDDQQSIHFYVSSKYFDLKRSEMKPIEILKNLADIFMPPSSIKNPTYVSIAQSIVLFFFDDCTIFEKTVDESNEQLDLFADL
ncbi:hypothetical protein IRZ71_02460 [Flavobacterium sp. ANB]|uniref:hypothetical protein n=1 Tax=unclassified Flavobacterium TaxID=196869 RepID=UPI0012B9C050|nr:MULTISPECIES: hypothetical protein [unclassified Flavobacterium]MBF4515182.1 hypothetical protein [Flavobacterium sp. ANB]MTD70094.1 hypothetical protein [Flavobacterium sp. LC2016-13]